MVYSFKKLGGRPHSRRLLEGFSYTVLECRLEDLGFVGCEFTWEKFRVTPNWIQERLDRGFANQRFRNLFPNAVVHVLEVSTSDHLPLLLNLNMQVYMPKAKRFCFENIWVRESECLNLVRDNWNVNGNESIMEKIEYVCLKLEEWGGGKVKEMESDCLNLVRDIWNVNGNESIMEKIEYVCLKLEE
ncbi:uncharacterized protein LOC141699666 [Apium graveolens]|uniref:uncharacterized protein LOC141699666 n=1 Tax=Apium graveolens TaxID=4045 RepID=UPI003D7B8B4C